MATAVGGVALSTALFTTMARHDRRPPRRSHDAMEEVGSVTQGDSGINNVHRSEISTNQWLARDESADHERHDTDSPQERIAVILAESSHHLNISQTIHNSCDVAILLTQTHHKTESQ